MRRKRQEESPCGMDELEGLEVELCGLCMQWIDAMAQLSRARNVTAQDRLACVFQDCLLPALRDLGSITVEAREHAQQPVRRRRPDAHRSTDRRSR